MWYKAESEMKDLTARVDDIELKAGILHATWTARVEDIEAKVAQKHDEQALGLAPVQPYGGLTELKEALNIQQENLETIRRNMAIIDRKHEFLTERVMEGVQESKERSRESKSPRILSRIFPNADTYSASGSSVVGSAVVGGHTPRTLLQQPMPMSARGNLQVGVPVSSVEIPLPVKRSFSRSLSPSRITTGSLPEALIKREISATIPQIWSSEVPVQREVSAPITQWSFEAPVHRPPIVGGEYDPAHYPVVRETSATIPQWSTISTPRGEALSIATVAQLNEASLQNSVHQEVVRLTPRVGQPELTPRTLGSMRAPVGSPRAGGSGTGSMRAAVTRQISDGGANGSMGGSFVPVAPIVGTGSMRVQVGTVGKPLPVTILG